MNLPSAISILQFTVAGTLFLLIATANGAGYRYGVSDQAFYIPGVTRALDSSVFPRDGSFIDSEGRLMVIDDLLAATARWTGLSLPALFLSAYLLSVALLWAGLVLIGLHVYRSPWVVAAPARGGAAITRAAETTRWRRGRGARVPGTRPRIRESRAVSYILGAWHSSRRSPAT